MAAVALSGLIVEIGQGLPIVHPVAHKHRAITRVVMLSVCNGDAALSASLLGIALFERAADWMFAAAFTP